MAIVAASVKVRHRILFAEASVSKSIFPILAASICCFSGSWTSVDHNRGPQWYRQLLSALGFKFSRVFSKIESYFDLSLNDGSDIVFF